ncbi:MAG TPA: diacylglycerol kinase family protein [Phycisphaerales bacterium]|nr:diacylglycerol kinase family protein [Phycisphaerales bacterium]
MTVLIVTNEASGCGRAKGLGAAIAAALKASDSAPEVRDARLCTAGECFAAFDAVVIVGGDGTLHHLLRGLAASGAPVYHVPAGTENLFAREFGMGADASALRDALRRRRELPVDLATIAGRPFALMFSIGPDAGVIHRLHNVRKRAAGHLMYVRPVLQELGRPHLPRVRVVVDGGAVVEGERGVLLVANCRQYARRLNPARDADMRDGVLDIVFFPARSSAGVIAWGARCARGAQFAGRGALRLRGREVEITALDRAPWQCDGEAGGWLGPGEQTRITLHPAALRVLCP